MAVDEVLGIEYMESGERSPEIMFRDFVDRVSGRFRPVIDKDLTAPPVSPVDGDSYIVAAGATGDWSGQAKDIARWDDGAAAWVFTTPLAGWLAWAVDEATAYIYNGSAWVLASTIFSNPDADTLDGHDSTYFATDADLDSHVANTANPHAVTKTQVGLGNADNTSDANKPVSTAQQAALDAKASFASPITWAETQLFSKYQRWSSDTAAQITADQNDYALGNAGVQRLSTDALRTVTGIAATTSGDLRIITNVGSFSLKLAHSSASSAAANRILCPDSVDLTVLAGQSVLLRYDGTLSKWRVLFVTPTALKPLRTVTASTDTLTSGDLTILYDTTSNNITATLPTAVGRAGQRYILKRISGGSNVVTIATTSSQTIDGATTRKLGAQYQWIEVESDGANWVIVGQNRDGVVPLTDAATIAIDSELGVNFSCSSAADRTFGAPSGSPKDRQKLDILWKNTDSASHTPTLTTGSGGFRYGTDLTALPAVAAGKTLHFAATYNLADLRWDVKAAVNGF